MDQHQRLCELIKRFWHKTQCCKYSAQFNKEYIFFCFEFAHTSLPNLTHRTIYMYWPLYWCLCCILKSWKWALILTTKFTWVCTIYEAAKNSCEACGNIREVRRSSEAETRSQLVHFPLHQGSWPALTRDWIMERFICLDLLYSFVHRIHPFGANLRSSLKFSMFKFFTYVMYLLWSN